MVRRMMWLAIPATAAAPGAASTAQRHYDTNLQRVLDWYSDVIAADHVDMGSKYMADCYQYGYAVVYLRTLVPSPTQPSNRRGN